MNSKPSTGNTIPAARLAAIAAELRELEERRARLLAEQVELLRHESDTLPLSPTVPFHAPAPGTSLTPRAKDRPLPLALRLPHRRLSPPLGKSQDRPRRLLPAFFAEPVPAALARRRERAAILSELARLADTGQGFVLFATASLLGEGFDLPRLDTLFLTTPVSFSGRVIPYAGRPRRAHAAKTDVRIHDYHEPAHRLSAHMHRKRVAAPSALGYQLDAGASSLFNLPWPFHPPSSCRFLPAP